MKRKCVTNHILCKKWTMFKEKLLILHDKHSTMLFFLRSFLKNVRVKSGSCRFGPHSSSENEVSINFRRKGTLKSKADVGFLFYTKKLL